MENRTGEDGSRFNRMFEKVTKLFQEGKGYPGLVEFEPSDFDKYPAIKIPTQKLTVRQCELMVMYICKRAGEPEFDTLGHLSYLGFNTLMEDPVPLGWNPIFHEPTEEELTTKVPLFHKCDHLKEDWLTLDGSSKLFPECVMQELTEMEGAGEFKSVKLICRYPNADDYTKMDNIGRWALRFLELLAIKDAKVREERACEIRSNSLHQSDVYKFPKLDLCSEIARQQKPLKRETLYLFFRGIIISEKIVNTVDLHSYRQHEKLLELGFDKFRLYNQELAAQYKHIFTMYEEQGLNVTKCLVNNLPDKWAYLGSTIACLIYHRMRTSWRSRYADYARLFDQKYYQQFGIENNRLLLSILIGASSNSLAPQFIQDPFSADETDEIKEAHQFGSRA